MLMTVAERWVGISPVTPNRRTVRGQFARGDAVASLVVVRARDRLVRDSGRVFLEAWVGSRPPS